VRACDAEHRREVDAAILLACREEELECALFGRGVHAAALVEDAHEGEVAGGLVAAIDQLDTGGVDLEHPA
jgi:hypothetical protein